MAPIFQKGLYHIPPEWYEAAIGVMEAPGVCAVLGPTDVGKTTFARFLIHELLKKGMGVAFVDSDLGQSYLGPPATISLGLFSAPDDEVRPLAMRFVGSVTPVGHLLQTVVDTKRLVDRAQTYGPHCTVIDTSGLVSGGAAFQLKLKKMDLLRPRHILALQREGEVEHILRAFEAREGVVIHRLPPSEKVRVRTREERISYRERAFRRYFKDSTLLEIDLAGVFVFGNRDLPFPIPDALVRLPLKVDTQLFTSHLCKGLIVGLNDGENDTIALGVVEGVKGEVMALKTPLRDGRGVKMIHIGEVRVHGGR